MRERAQQEQDRRLTRVLPLLVPVVPAVVALMLWLGRVPLNAWSVAGVAASAVPPLVLVIEFFRVRGKDRHWLRAPLALGVEPERRKEVLARVRAGQAVAEQDQVIAVDVARRALQRKPVTYGSAAPVGFLIVARLLSGEFLPADVVFYLIFVGMIVVVSLNQREVRCAENWLAQHAPKVSRRGR
ncbi:hypothetical protein [Kineosporia babensis]|uniref:Uncharacterized protein n=1 Tax=Kineosporia babensis TaxID=499548 RepID=A0A9X1NB37_9ACTN|nr:hypothetical protein [Kineosporia babensis]MCD5310474.1 hypothetical protein [Kineosporia babensis]